MAADNNMLLEIMKIATPVLQTGLAVAGFFLGLKQARNSLKQREDDLIWRQSEFAANKFKDFFEDFHVRNALQILDWKIRKVYLWKNDQTKTLKVDHEMLTSALATKDKFTPDEALIRDTFDEFFTKLGYFENYIRGGVLSEQHVRPYLARPIHPTDGLS